MARSSLYGEWKSEGDIVPAAHGPGAADQAGGRSSGRCLAVSASREPKPGMANDRVSRGSCDWAQTGEGGCFEGIAAGGGTAGSERRVWAQAVLIPGRMQNGVRCTCQEVRRTAEGTEDWAESKNEGVEDK